MFSEMQQDILTEQVNIYIGKAASYLSEMIDRKIMLSIPQITLLEASSEKELFKPELFSGHVMSSGISFGDSISGKAQLMFPTNKIKKLVALCMGEEFSESDDENLDFLDNDLDVIKEIGNIILNSVVGGFSNFLGVKVSFKIPEIEIFDSGNYTVSKDNNYVLLVMNLLFSVANTDISGMIMCYLNLDSINAIVENIDKIEAELYGNIE